jgi:mono/diheme cytochrome c family protein/plastocyanin
MNRIPEWTARLFLAALFLGLIVVLIAARWFEQRDVVELHAVMPDAGGWLPENLTVEAGKELNLRLVSDDVIHGFAVGQSDRPEIELKPGQPVETTLVFDEPGKYTYYCTRWCGPDHWRMRGVIEVTGNDVKKGSQTPPLYVELGMDLDAGHTTDRIPSHVPSAVKGAALGVNLPAVYRSIAYYQTHSPAQAWNDLGAESNLAALDDEQVWDLVAYTWSLQTTPEALSEGQRLYAANCAACHGESGQGDGVMAPTLAGASMDDENHSGSNDQHDEILGHDTTKPTDFTDPEHMLGASPAVLHGKIVRGGMGTGMPYWGPIFTEQQIWNIVSFLWTYQFQYSEVRNDTQHRQ